MKQLILKMPRLGETMEQGTMVDWLVDTGESFKRGDPILELETDKTIVEFSALGNGIISEILAQPGDIVDVGDPIAQLDVENTGDWDVGGENPQDNSESDVPIVPDAQSETVKKPDIIKPTEGAQIRATPAARRLARQMGVALKTLTGSGRNGRIEIEDVTAQKPQQESLNGPATYLLIHGFAGDSSTWAQLEATLKRAGHSVYTPDLAGHGANRTQVNDPEELVDGMLEFAKNIPRPFHIVGHSLGAWVATRVAAALGDDVASLRLIAPIGAGDEISTDFINGIVRVTNTADLIPLLGMLSPKADTLSKELLSEMAKELSNGRLIELAGKLAHSNGQRIDILQPLAKISKDILISAIVGKDDLIIPPTHAFNLPPRVGVHFVAAGHMPHWDTPNDVARLIAGKAYEA
ncbi:MAG: alpha/beta fold hydrolase [Devosiaceae bacterium]|nr:alpha/beta fold hydrolase [Devosiaceae bacterium]